MIVQFEKTAQNLKVVDTAKDTGYKGPPYATDIYKAALEIAKTKSLLLTSDQLMSDNGLGVWKRLLANGNRVAVYDVTQPGQSLIPIQSEQDFYQYFNDSPDYRKYRFVLSENKQHFFETVYDWFVTRRIRELAGITCDETITQQKEWRDIRESHNNMRTQ